MRRLHNVAAWRVVLAVATLIASVAIAQSPLETPAAAAPAAAADAAHREPPLEPASAPAAEPELEPEPAPDPNAFGTVIFFRPGSMGGDIRVIENGATLNVLESGTYFVVKEPVGRHNYITKLLDLVTIEVEEGDTYYVTGEVSMRFGMGGGKRQNLRPATRAEFEAVQKKLRNITRPDR